MNRILFAAVYVSDQDRALRFYVQLGFEKSSDREMGEDGRWLIVSRTGTKSRALCSRCRAPDRLS